MNNYGRQVIYTSERSFTDKNILDIVFRAMSVHNQNVIDIQRLYDYYRGKMKILNREKEVRPEINNKVVINHAAEITNLALLHAAFSSGKTKKRWKTFGDSRVRGTHRAAAGQTVPLDQPFIVGNSRLMFPCDSSLGASPAEIVNCRCTIEYI